MNNNNSNIHYYLLGGILVLFIVLIGSTALIKVDSNYEFLEFQISNETSNYNLIKLTLENKNDILSKRVELLPIYLCIYNKDDGSLILSDEMRSNLVTSLSSDIFNLNEEFVDIRPNSITTITYEVTVYPHQYRDVEDISKLYGEYRKVTSKETDSWRYRVSENVCEEVIPSEIIYSVNK